MFPFLDFGNSLHSSSPGHLLIQEEILSSEIPKEGFCIHTLSCKPGPYLDELFKVYFSVSMGKSCLAGEMTEF